MRGTTIGWVLTLALATSAAAQEDEGEWLGTWGVKGERGATRLVEADGPGRIAVGLVVEGQPVRCAGTGVAPPLALEGTLPRGVGIVGALEGREGDGGPQEEPSEAPRRAGGDDGSSQEGRARRGSERGSSPADHTDGRPGRVRVDVLRVVAGEVASVRVSVDGRRVREEVWTRPGPARLELLSTSARYADFDPRGGPLEVQVRVGGRAQRVELSVHLPGEERLSDRVAFYRVRAGVKGDALVTLPGPELPPGLHTLWWDGRDQTPDRRLAVSGPYVLRVDSPERRADRDRPRATRDAPTTRIAVAKPRALVHAPVYTDGGAQVSDLAGPLPPALSAGFVVQHEAGRLTPSRFLDRLAGSAAGFVVSHGLPARFFTGDGAAAEVLQPWDVVTSSDRLGPKPLKDVHALFLTSCLVARPYVGRFDDGSWGSVDLVQVLLQAGVDVVVASRETILSGDGALYLTDLGPRLLRAGMTVDRAVRDAAHQAYEQFWQRWVPAERWRLRCRLDLKAYGELLDLIARVTPVKEAMQVFVAPGIDRNAEALVPPRHGCSTN